VQATTSQIAGPDTNRTTWRVEVRDPIRGDRCTAAVVVDDRNQILFVGPVEYFGGAFHVNGAVMRQLAAAVDQAEALVAERTAHHG
jgi:hypothetical protein